MCDGDVKSEDCLMFDETFSRYGTITADLLDAGLKKDSGGSSSSSPRTKSKAELTVLLIFVSYLALFKSLS